MPKRKWLGRSLWLAVWCAWAGFGYWLYVNLPRTFVFVCELPVEPEWTCLGFVRDTQLVAYRMNGFRVGGPDDPIAVFDVATGFEKRRIHCATWPWWIGTRFEPSVESGLAAVPLLGDDGDGSGTFGVEIVDLTSDERRTLPEARFTRFDGKHTFHRSYRWIGAYWEDIGPRDRPRVRRRIAVYDAESKAFLFDSFRPDENDPSAYFVGAPIFVDGARRFGVLVDHPAWARPRLDLWDLPEGEKPLRTFSTSAPGEIERAADRIDRITANGVLVFRTSRQLSYYNLNRGCIELRISSDDLRFRFLDLDAGSIVIDPDNRRCLRTDDVATVWKWPTDESMAWHDGRRVCWMNDAATNGILGGVHIRANSLAKALKLHSVAFVLRDLTTGRFRCRAFAPDIFPAMNPTWIQLMHSLTHGDRAGKYFVTANGLVYHAEPRPMWGLIALAQAILATPLLLVWLFRRWRRRRAANLV